MERLKGKIAIITGAASGVGEATALLFAAEGAKVVVADINYEGTQSVVNKIGATGGRAIGLAVDVTKVADIDRCIEETQRQFGQLDILVNNAGMASGHGSSNSVDPWEEGITTSLSSVYWMSRAALPLLKQQCGTIVNVSSLAGNYMGTPVSWYCSAKSGMLGLTRSLATTHGPEGVRTNAICLGAIDTPRLRAILNAMPEQEAIHNKRSPLRRLGRAAEIANVALFLASDESSYINGQVIVADGGFSIAG